MKGCPRLRDKEVIKMNEDYNGERLSMAQKRIVESVIKNFGEDVGGLNMSFERVGDSSILGEITKDGKPIGMAAYSADEKDYQICGMMKFKEHFDATREDLQNYSKGEKKGRGGCCRKKSTLKEAADLLDEELI